jgi:DNA-binding beta-propeller fold protein YncE
MFRLHPRSASGGRRRLWLGVAAPATALLASAVPARAASFAYVTNPDVGLESSVSQYSIAPQGELAPLVPPTVGGGRSPNGVAVSPAGESVYVANSDFNESDIFQYDVGPGGALSPKNPATVGGSGGTPIHLAVSPDGQSAYVTTVLEGSAPGTVSQYDIDPSGRLSPKTPPTVAAGDSPIDVAVTPDGKSVYVTNFSADTVSQYGVGPVGRLSPRTPPTVAAGDGPIDVAVAPDGSSVYVPNFNADTVSQYDVGPGGKLTPKSPAALAAGDGPSGVEVNPDGKSVYVTNSTGDNVSQYHVGPGGKLSPKIPPTVAAGDAPSGVAVTPGGNSVYVTNFSDGGPGTVSQYDVGPAGGLSPKSPPAVAADRGPNEVAVGRPNCRVKGGGRFIDTIASNGRVVRKGDSLSSDKRRPVGSPNSGIAQNLHLEWGPPGDPQRHSFQLRTKLALAQCLDTPGVNPGQGQGFDTFVAEGRGTVDGSPRFKVRVRLTDGGENPFGSGVGKDGVRVKITRVSDGRPVLLASGQLGAGNQDARDGA